MSKDYSTLKEACWTAAKWTVFVLLMNHLVWFGWAYGHKYHECKKYRPEIGLIESVNHCEAKVTITY